MKSLDIVFLNGDLATQKLITLISIMMTDRLFFDFIYEVISEKIIIGSNEVSESDIRIFFNNINCEISDFKNEKYRINN